MRVLIVTGMPGAGKEEFVDVSRRMDFDVVRMGDVVRAEALRMGLASDDKSVGGFAHSERERNGFDIWAKRTTQFVKGEMTVIDGCRGEAELQVFKKAFGDGVVVIAIHASPETRYSRLVLRNRTDAPENRKHFEERDRRELSWGLGSLIALADRMIVNEDTLDEFKEEAKKLLKELSVHEVQGH
ncbi:MAG: flagellar hook-basal body complex protein FliE [Methanomassiliicoccales archaeon]|nr:flagellar hook-basal body complex protein FliE [Methanomassiliicoccales archaeon]